MSTRIRVIKRPPFVHATFWSAWNGRCRQNGQLTFTQSEWEHFRSQIDLAKEVLPLLSKARDTLSDIVAEATFSVEEFQTCSECGEEITEGSCEPSCEMGELRSLLRRLARATTAVSVGALMVEEEG